MSTILYRNAQLLLNGQELTGALHDLTLDSTSEMLDATVFGLFTRTHKAGLSKDSISGKGFFDGAVGIEQVLFNDMGGGSPTSNPLYMGGAILDPALFVVFPDGVTEGSILAGTGFVVKGVVSQMMLGGAVGTLLDISFEVQNAGTDS